MAQIENTQEAAVIEAVSKTEEFFEKNGKKLLAAIVAVILVFACGYAYKKLVVDANADKAANLIVEAQDRIAGENPDYLLALNGDENGAGFLDVIEQYGSTPSANLARQYAGACYLHLGDLENAEKYLKQYSDVDGVLGQIVNAQNKGLLGDVAAEKQEYTAAAALYKKAAELSKNNYTTPLFMFKQALALKAAGEGAKATEVLEALVAAYPGAMETRDAEKILGTIK